MKETVTWKRLDADTVNGHTLQVTTTYSSFDQAEIDKLQELIAKKVGQMLVVEGDKK